MEPGPATTRRDDDDDEKKKQRGQAPATTPGAVSSTSNRSPRAAAENVKIRPVVPASRPGVIAATPNGSPTAPSASEPAEPAQRKNSLNAGEGATATASASPDEKANYRGAAPAAARPGVVAVQPSDSADGPPGKTEDDDLASKIALFNVSPASRPQGGVKATPAVSASTTSQTTTMSAEDQRAAIQIAEADMLAKRQAAAGAGATAAGAVAASGINNQSGDLSVEDKNMAVQMVESDILAKQRVGPNMGTTKSGAVSSLSLMSGESGLSEADQMAAVEAVESDILMKQRVGPAAAAAGAAAVGGAAAADDTPGAVPETTRPRPKTREEMEKALDAMEQEHGVGRPTSRTTIASSAGASSVGGGGTTSLHAAQSGAFSIQGPGFASTSATTLDTTFDAAMSRQPSVEFVLSSHSLSMSKQDLALAVPVDPEAEKQLLPTPEDDFDPTKGRQRLYQRPRFMVLLVCFVCVGIVSIIAGIVIGIEDNETSIETVAPSMAPTLAPTSSDEVFLRAWLETRNISQATLDSSPVAYDMAVHWYADEDRYRNRSIAASDPDYPWDFERFILAWFYFATSSNGTVPWLSCNPPRYDLGENDTCTFLQATGEANDRSYVNYTQEPGTNRWLSNSSYCTWPGIICWPTINDPVFGICSEGVQQMILPSFGLSGPFPPMLNQLYCIGLLIVQYNSGLTGSLPPELFEFANGTLSQMQVLEFYNNSGMKGPIPETVWEEPLQLLKLTDSGFTGTIPRLNISNLAGLRELWLFGNSLGGRLPVLDNRQLPQLSSLRLHRGGFTGRIPSEYGTLPLRHLWLFDNELTGSVPAELGNCPMRDFRVQRNQLSGAFPPVPWGRVTRMELFANKFNGTLPATLVGMTRMRTLALGENEFTGAIDPDVGNNLVRLQSLTMEDNKFRGPIPATLGNLNQLTSLWIHFNDLTGEFPMEICNRRSQNGLAFIQADCLAYPPQNYCFCCTTCCDGGLQSCQLVNREREDDIEDAVLGRRRVMAELQEDSPRDALPPSRSGRSLGRLPPFRFASSRVDRSFEA